MGVMSYTASPPPCSSRGDPVLAGVGVLPCSSRADRRARPLLTVACPHVKTRPERIPALLVRAGKDVSVSWFYHAFPRQRCERYGVATVFSFGPRLAGRRDPSVTTTRVRCRGQMLVSISAHSGAFRLYSPIQRRLVRCAVPLRLRRTAMSACQAGHPVPRTR